MSYFGSYECMDMHCPGSKSDEQLAAAIAAYLEEHPIDAGLDEAALAAAIAAYLEEHPIDAVLDEAALAAYLVENGYLKNTDLADAITQALAEAKASGQFDGDPGEVGADGSPGADGADGVGIESVVQTTTSTEDSGTNVITVTKTDGTTSTFQVKNGSKGNDGAPGKDGANGADGTTPNIQIGTVETLPAGSPATASMTGTAENPLLNLGIPKGADGASGSGDSYILPVASADTLGGVKPAAKTDDMTQPVGVDADGKLFAPSVGGKWISIGTVTAKNDGEALVVDGFSAERIRITAMLAAVNDNKGLRFFISEDMYDKQFNLGLSLTTSLRPITFEMQIVGEYAVTSAFILPKSAISANAINSIYIGGVQLPDGETTLKRFGVTSANDKLIAGSWLRIEVWQQ